MSAIQFLRRDIARSRFITTLEKQLREIRVTKITKICWPSYQLHQRQRVEGDLCGQQEAEYHVLQEESSGKPLQTLAKRRQKVVPRAEGRTATATFATTLDGRHEMGSNKVS